MSSPAIARPQLQVPHLPGAAASQATVIEQSRAAAEVVAAVMAARATPRDVQNAVVQMEEACGIPALAERAFYRFPRGGQTVSGPSIQLARELARCWGNLQYGVNELRREANGSEMQAFAWDLQANTREVRTFFVPHIRDTNKGPSVLTDGRDIYENNANLGARRVRETILDLVPVWFVERAKQLCADTIQKGGGKPLAQRIADAIKHYREVWNVTEGQLAAKVGRPVSEWTALDLAPLIVISQSLGRSETTVGDEFPREDTTAAAAELTPVRNGGPRERTTVPTTAAAEPAVAEPAPAAPAAPAESPAEPAPAADTSGPAPKAMTTQIGRLIAAGGVNDDTQRRAVAAHVAGHEGPLASTSDLTRDQGMRIIQALGAAKDAGTLEQVVADALAATAAPAGELELPTPGTRAWHVDGHPTESGGHVTRVKELRDGSCGICVPEDEDDPRDDDQPGQS